MGIPKCSRIWKQGGCDFAVEKVYFLDRGPGDLVSVNRHRDHVDDPQFSPQFQQTGQLAKILLGQHRVNAYLQFRFLVFFGLFFQGPNRLEGFFKSPFDTADFVMRFPVDPVQGEACGSQARRNPALGHAVYSWQSRCWSN